MISHRYRTIFIHIPKCGGTSVEDVLWPKPRQEADLWGGFVDRYHNRHQTGGLQHLMAHHIVAEVGAAVFADYFTFALVRNPFARAVSQFKYTMAGRRDLRDYIGLADGASFLDYLQAIGRRLHVQWDEQHRFVCDADGRVLVDRVVKLERADAEMPALLARLTGEPAAMPHANQSADRRSYRDFYGEAERELVTRIYARDLAVFDYAF